jgi:hypothetical protein
MWAEVDDEFLGTSIPGNKGKTNSPYLALLWISYKLALALLDVGKTITLS